MWQNSRYIGLDIVQNEHGITLHQKELCKSLKFINVSTVSYLVLSQYLHF